ncbi:acyltransferase [Clostridium transplantifaecale]|uniref:acyltransferase n=1 Tax=Clostridium transplantifaecale TaxID=2479838 RepID=UPI000F6345D6|nr:acyltransferase [Clostridium transplantifaecale]
MKNKKRGLALIITGLIAAICIELCLACFSARRGSILEENITILPEYAADAAADGKPYRMAEDMPWLDFAPHTAGGYLEFEFAAPVPDKMQVLVYYTENEGQEFNRFRRIERWILKGTTKGRVALPAGYCDRLRLTLTGDAEIENVSMSIPAVRPAFGEAISLVNPVRLLAIFLILALSILLHHRERREQKLRKSVNKGNPGIGCQGSGERRKRTAYLDGVRVLAALFVVAVHVVEPVALAQIKGTPRDFVFRAVVLIVLTCNLLFFFISGALLLPYREETIGEYYKKRVLKILLPFALYSLFYLKVLCATQEGILGWGGQAALDFLGGTITMGPHLWLIYKLLALYLLVPFYRLMMAKMPERTEKQLFVLIVAALAIRTGCEYLNFDLGISLYLDSWLGLFLAGYLLNRAWMRKYDLCLVSGGILALIISLWIYSFRADYLEIITNCSILEFLMASAVFVTVLRMNGICVRFSKILQILGKRSFSVLMVHLFVMSAVLPLGFVPYGMVNKSIGQLVLPYLFICAVSYAIAVLYDETVVKVFDAGAERLLAGKNKRRKR